MRRIALLMLTAVALLGGCGDAKSYAHFGDRMRYATGGIFGVPCDSGERDRNGMIEFLPTEQCYRMAPAQRMRGVWIRGLEESRFYPGLTAAPVKPRAELLEPEDLLDYWTYNIPQLSGGRRGPGARVALVDFIGRRTLHPGPHGHWGRRDHLIVMQRLISARELRQPEGVAY